MELVLNGFPVKLSKTKENIKTADNRRKQLALEVNECLEEIKRNELLFNMEVDDDMLDSFIYEREALMCRYRSLIRRIKHAR